MDSPSIAKGAFYAIIKIEYDREDDMYERILKQMREKIRTRQYVMTLHAEEEMADDNLAIFDIERVFLTGQIIERQKDRKTKEWKYIVEGETVTFEIAVAVGKLSMAGKLVIITVYKK